MKGRLVIHNNELVSDDYIIINKNKLSTKYNNLDNYNFLEWNVLLDKHGENNKGFWINNSLYNSYKLGKIGMGEFLALLQTYNIEVIFLKGYSKNDEKIYKFLKKHKFNVSKKQK